VNENHGGNEQMSDFHVGPLIWPGWLCGPVRAGQIGAGPSGERGEAPASWVSFSIMQVGWGALCRNAQVRGVGRRGQAW
jgi:hypothetical protein